MNKDETSYQCLSWYSLSSSQSIGFRSLFVDWSQLSHYQGLDFGLFLTCLISGFVFACSVLDFFPAVFKTLRGLIHCLSIQSFHVDEIVPLLYLLYGSRVVLLLQTLRLTFSILLAVLFLTTHEYQLRVYQTGFHCDYWTFYIVCRVSRTVCWHLGISSTSMLNTEKKNCMLIL